MVGAKEVVWCLQGRLTVLKEEDRYNIRFD